MNWSLDANFENDSVKLFDNNKSSTVSILTNMELYYIIHSTNIIIFSDLRFEDQLTYVQEQRNKRMMRNHYISCVCFTLAHSSIVVVFTSNFNWHRSFDKFLQITWAIVSVPLLVLRQYTVMREAYDAYLSIEERKNRDEGGNLEMEMVIFVFSQIQTAP